MDTPSRSELTFLGVILDRKLTWISHIEACTKKAKQLAVAMTSCARAKWGLGRRVVQQIYKGAVEPIMLNGVVAWAAALSKRGAQRRLRSVQRLAALAMTGCFRTTSTNAALALAGLLPRRKWLLGSCRYSSTAMAPCPGDWRSSVPRASGRVACTALSRRQAHELPAPPRRRARRGPPPR